MRLKLRLQSFNSNKLILNSSHPLSLSKYRKEHNCNRLKDIVRKEIRDTNFTN